MKLALLFIASLAWAQDQPATSGETVEAPMAAQVRSLSAENALLHAQLDQLKQEAAYAAQVCALPDLILARARTIQAQQAIEAQKKQAQPAPAKPPAQ